MNPSLPINRLHQPTPSQLRFIAEKKARAARIAAKAYRPAELAERMADKEAMTEKEVPPPVEAVDFQAQFRELWDMMSEEASEAAEVHHRRVGTRDCAKACADYYGVSLGDILSARRTTIVMRPRQVACYLAKQLTLRALTEIGSKMGGRDHTTILHAVRKITAQLQSDPELRSEVSALIQIIEGL